MIRNGEITFSEVRRVFRAYWWILPIAVVGCGALGLGSALVLPKRYTSETLVLVDQPRVPTEYVKPVVTDDLNHRLARPISRTLGVSIHRRSAARNRVARQLRAASVTFCCSVGR